MLVISNWVLRARPTLKLLARLLPDIVLHSVQLLLLIVIIIAIVIVIIVVIIIIIKYY